jgi:hypothetical protein
MKTNIHSFGRLQVQIDWGKETWYYISRHREKINMMFFLGTVEFEGGSLRQFIIGPLAISWGWKS